MAAVMIPTEDDDRFDPSYEWHVIPDKATVTMYQKFLTGHGLSEKEALNAISDEFSLSLPRECS